MKVLATLFPTLRVWPQFMTSHVIDSLYTMVRVSARQCGPCIDARLLFPTTTVVRHAIPAVCSSECLALTPSTGTTSEWRQPPPQSTVALSRTAPLPPTPLLCHPPLSVPPLRKRGCLHVCLGTGVFLQGCHRAREPDREPNSAGGAQPGWWVGAYHSVSYGENVYYVQQPRHPGKQVRTCVAAALNSSPTLLPIL